MKVSNFFKRIILPAVFLFSAYSFSAVKKDSMIIAPFGKVHIYVPNAPIESVTIMISGDGGWKFGVLDFANHFAEKNSLVIGVDILTYYKNLKSRKEDCYRIYSDFVTLATTVEKKYNLSQYKEPILMGYSSGATMVYAILAQARPNTFMGGISVGFCPDVELPKHFCELNGLKQHTLSNGKSFDLDPDSQLGNRWIVLNGKLDEVCTYQATTDFINKTSDAELIMLDKVGHGFSNWKDFMPQWDQAFESLLVKKKDKLTTDTKGDLKSAVDNLPIIVTTSKIKSDKNTLFFFISGDGGWYSFEQNFSNYIADLGVPTIGLDAKKYFWNKSTPEATATDVSNILNYYSEELDKNTFVLIGYSMGAEVIPFIYEKLPAETQRKVSYLVLLSPEEKGDFEIHVSNMLGFESKNNSYNVVSQLKKINNEKSILVITGNTEVNSLPSKLASTKVQFEKVPGDHHYNNNTEQIITLLKNKKIL